MSATTSGTTSDTTPGADPLLVETVERLLRDRSTFEEVEHAEQAGGWSEPAWAALAEAGFPWVGIPEAAGGSGGTLFDAAAILHAAGRFATPVPLAETGFVGGWALAAAGLTLPDGPVTAVEAPGLVVGDRLTVGGVAAFARHAAAIVVAGDGVVHVLAPDQVEITPGASLAGEARDRVSADVALADLQQGPLDGGYAALAARGSLSRAVLAAGALAAVSQMTIDYTHERRQFGKPVATFQAVQQHLVTVAQSAVRAQMAADVAVRALAGGDVTIEIAAARAVVDDAIGLGTRAAHQAHGAMGVTREYPLHQLTRRLWSWRHDWSTTKHWRRQLGHRLAETGPDALFLAVTR